MALSETTIWDTVVSDHEHVWDNINSIGREAMVGFLQDGESVLDVGCGNGFVYRKAKEKGLTFSNYAGVDLSEKFILAASKLSPEGTWLRADATDLPFQDDLFDTVILMHVLECCDGFEKPVMEALRVAKKRVVVCFWKQFADKTEIKPTDPYGFESVYSQADWFAFLEKIGMPTAPWLEVHAEANRSNLFFVLEKKNLSVMIAPKASPEVEKAIDSNSPPNRYTEVKRDIEQENYTWTPPVDTFGEGPTLVAAGHAAPTPPPKEEAQPSQSPERYLKGLGSRGVQTPPWLNTAVVDSDDLSDEHDPYDFLVNFKKQFPKFKITLFTIPKKCSLELLEKYKELDWVELAVHGYTHEPNTEFQNLSYEDVDMRVMAAYGIGRFDKVFKAPGWQISDAALQWFKDNDWTVMDQHYNNDRRPEGLKTVVYADDPTLDNRAEQGIVHTHTWDCCGNGIEEVLSDPWMFNQGTEFKFISEVAQPWQK